MSIKPRTVPAKRLAQSINSTDLSLKLNNILDWDGVTDLVAGDFGTELFAVLMNETKTTIEIVELDPTTIAATNITILRRGLAFDGTIVELAARKLAWPANETTVQLGADVPQMLAQYFDAGSDQTATGLKTFTQFPEKSGLLTPTAAEQFATKDYVDQTATGNSLTDQVLVSGVAGETLALGQVVYFKEADGKWWLADSDAVATSKNVKRGFAQTVAVANDPINVLIEGTEKNQIGLTLGSKYYISGTPGGISTTPGTNNVLLGWAKSTTELIVSEVDDLAGYATTERVAALESGAADDAHAIGMSLVYGDLTTQNKPNTNIIHDGFATTAKQDAGSGLFVASEPAGQTVLGLQNAAQVSSFSAGKKVSVFKLPTNTDATLATWVYSETDPANLCLDGGVVSSKRQLTRSGGVISMGESTRLTKVYSVTNGVTYSFQVTMDFLEANFANLYTTVLVVDGNVVQTKTGWTNGETATLSGSFVAVGATATIYVNTSFTSSGNLPSRATTEKYYNAVLSAASSTPEEVTVTALHTKTTDATIASHVYTEPVGAAGLSDAGVVGGKRQVNWSGILNASPTFTSLLTSTLTGLVVGRVYNCSVTIDLTGSAFFQTVYFQVDINGVQVGTYNSAGGSAFSGVVLNFSFTAAAATASIVLRNTHVGVTNSNENFQMKWYNQTIGEDAVEVTPAITGSYGAGDQIARVVASVDTVGKKLTMVAGLTNSSYFTKLMRYQPRTAGATGGIWITRNSTAQFNLAAGTIGGATSLTVTGDQTGKIGVGDTIDIFTLNNTVRERRVLTNSTFGAGVTTLSWATGLTNAYTTTSFVERIDVFPSISIVAIAGAESFVAPTWTRSVLDPANSETEDYYTFTGTPNHDVTLKVLLERRNISLVPYAKALIGWLSQS